MRSTTAIPEMIGLARLCRGYIDSKQSGKSNIHSSLARELMACETVAELEQALDSQLMEFVHVPLLRRWLYKPGRYSDLLHILKQRIEQYKSEQRLQQMARFEDLAATEAIALHRAYFVPAESAAKRLSELSEAQIQQLLSLVDLNTLPEKGQQQWMATLFTVLDAPFSGQWTIDKRSAVHFYMMHSCLASEIKPALRHKIFSLDAFIQIQSAITRMREMDQSCLHSRLDLVRLKTAVSHFDCFTADLQTQRDALMAQLEEVIAQKKADRKAFEAMRFHAYNLGLQTGELRAAVSDDVIEVGMGGAQAMRWVSENWSDYLVDLPSDQSDRWMPLLQHMQQDVAWNNEEHNFTLPDLTPGRMVGIDSGWRTHSVHMGVCCIQGVTYLAYANRGGRFSDSSCGVAFFEVSRPDLLQQPEFLKRLKVSYATGDLDKAFVEAGFTGAGVVTQLGLKPVYFMSRKEQKSGNCSVVAANNSVLTRMMFSTLTDIAQSKAETKKPLGTRVLTTADFKQAEGVALPAYKAFRRHSRDVSEYRMKVLMRNNELRCPSDARKAEVCGANRRLCRAIDAYKGTKYGEHAVSYSSTSSLWKQGGVIRSVVVGPRTWQAPRTLQGAGAPARNMRA